MVGASKHIREARDPERMALVAKSHEVREFAPMCEKQVEPLHQRAQCQATKPRHAEFVRTFLDKKQIRLAQHRPLRSGFS